jgi:hypothetical protein
MKLLRSAVMAFAVLAAGSITASAAGYQQYKVGNCPSTAACNVDFPVIPAGKTTTLSNVSCLIRPTLPASLNRIQLQQILANGRAGVIVTLVAAPTLIGDPGNIPNVFFVNNPVTIFATGGQKFRVRSVLTGGGYSEISCHIGGTQ